MGHWIVRGVDRGDGTRQRFEIEAASEDAARDQVADCLVVQTVKRNYAKEREVYREAEASRFEDAQLKAASFDSEQATEAERIKREAAVRLRAEGRMQTSAEAWATGAATLAGWLLIIGAAVSTCSMVFPSPKGEGVLGGMQTVLTYIAGASFFGVSAVIRTRATIRSLGARIPRTPGSSVDPNK